MVENLVKNWEIEASFKTRLSDWRTINQERYTFGMNGGPSSKVDYMLKQGTYNAILPSSEYYCPVHNDMSLSHKTFKRMMPTFAWEVLETYGSLPKVGCRWRHWGWMKNDYVAFNQYVPSLTQRVLRRSLLTTQTRRESHGQGPWRPYRCPGCDFCGTR